MWNTRDSRFVRIILIIFFVLFALYAAYEAHGLLFGPVIHLPAGTIISHNSFTSIRGRAERITELRLNGKTISVTENGDFEEPYVLAEGTNHLIFEARDNRGRSKTTTLDIVYEPVGGTRPAPATTSPR